MSIILFGGGVFAQTNLSDDVTHFTGGIKFASHEGCVNSGESFNLFLKCNDLNVIENSCNASYILTTEGNWSIDADLNENPIEVIGQGEIHNVTGIGKIYPIDQNKALECEDQENLVLYLYILHDNKIDLKLKVEICCGDLLDFRSSNSESNSEPEFYIIYDNFGQNLGTIENLNQLTELSTIKGRSWIFIVGIKDDRIFSSEKYLFLF